MRPTIGRLVISEFSTVRPIWALLVLTMEASPTTVTDSLAVPTSIRASTRATLLISSVIPLRTNFLKSLRRDLNLIVPDGQLIDAVFSG